MSKKVRPTVDCRGYGYVQDEGIVEAYRWMGTEKDSILPMDWVEASPVWMVSEYKGHSMFFDPTPGHDGGPDLYLESNNGFAKMVEHGDCIVRNKAGNLCVCGTDGFGEAYRKIWYMEVD